jgi:hypothetical protein
MIILLGMHLGATFGRTPRTARSVWRRARGASSAMPCHFIHDRREGIWNFIFAFLLRAMTQSQDRSSIAPAMTTSFAAPPPHHHHHLPSLFFHEHESITLAPAPSLHNTVIVRLESVTTVLQEDANKSNNNTTTKTTTTTTPFPQTIRQFMLDYGVSRLFLSTGSSSSSSTYNEQYHDLLHDEYTLGPSGISLVLEMHDQFTNNLQSSSLLEALESSRFLSFLVPWNHVLHHPPPAPLHRHVYTRRLSPTLVRMQVILPSLDGSAAAAVALESVREFFSSSSNCDGGMFAPHLSKDYSSILLGDSQTIQVSQTIRRSMWMDVQQQLSCQTTTTTRQDANEEEEQSVSEDDSSCCRRIVLKRGIQYGVVVVDAAAAASSPNGWNNSQVNKQEETRTAIPLSKLLLPFQNDFGHCDHTNNNNNKTTTRLSILQVASTTQKNDNPDEDESMEVNEYTIMDWNVNTTTTVDLNFVPTTLSSLGPKNYSNNGRLEANRILSRPNGVANIGTIVTTIQSSLACPVTVQVMEILPPILLPRWDTWTLTTIRTSTKPLLTFQSDGTIVVEYNVTLNPMTTINMTLDYEPALLPFQQFPADANRGIELPPTLFTFGNNNDASTCTNSSSITATTTNTTTTLYSAPLLFMPPVPDMSMPFNVVSLTCTLYAFIVGSVANLLVRKASRRIQCKLLHPEKEHKSTLQRVKEKLLQCNLTRIFQNKRVHHGVGDAAVAIGNETEDKRNANVEHKEVSFTEKGEESKMD